MGKERSDLKSLSVDDRKKNKVSTASSSGKVRVKATPSHRRS